MEGRNLLKISGFCFDGLVVSFLIGSALFSGSNGGAVAFLVIPALVLMLMVSFVLWGIGTLFFKKPAVEISSLSKERLIATSIGFLIGFAFAFVLQFT